MFGLTSQELAYYATSQKTAHRKGLKMLMKNGDHSALVSPQGGSILQWQYKEYMILGPTRMVRVGDELKARGESHWCYPNFGTPPPEWAILGKHGPFRKKLLEPDFGETSQFANFRSFGKYDFPKVRVNYNLGTEGLIAKFSVEHSYGAARSPILPAFHPYFAVPRDGFWASMNHVCIARAVPKSNNYWNVGGQANVIERTSDVAVELGGICRIALDLPDDCTHIVVWSDEPSIYVCVEPIFGKPGTFGKPEGRYIEPGERVECNIRLDFE